MQKQKRFDDRFKIHTVAQMLREDISYVDMAAKVGAGKSTVSRWKTQYHAQAVQFNLDRRRKKSMKETQPQPAPEETKAGPDLEALWEDATLLTRKPHEGSYSDARLRISTTGEKHTIMVGAPLRRKMEEAGLTNLNYATLRMGEDGWLFITFTNTARDNSMKLAGATTGYLDVTKINYTLPNTEWVGNDIHIMPKRNAIAVQFSKKESEDA